MRERKNTTSKSGVSNGINNLLETKTTYKVEGKAFVVTPVFKKEGTETLSSVLVKLMQSELQYEH